MDNLPFLEALYEKWLTEPGSVDPVWGERFRALDSDQQRPPTRQLAAAAGTDLSYLQSRVSALLWAYRDVGYMYAQLNPLGGNYSPSRSYLYSEHSGDFEQLKPEAFGIPPEAIDQVFSAGRAMQPERMPLGEIIQAFDETYCSSIGVEFLHIQSKSIRRWLLQQMESCRNKATLTRQQKRDFLEDLLKTEEFEHFLHVNFIGQKRFSLEGSEVVIPALHFLVDQGAQANEINEIVIGTTHRGRLSILQSILEMSPEEVFSEFEEQYGPGVYHGGGDVKYHIGYDTDHRHEDGGSVHVSIVANASHLESVDAIVQGKTRAHQDMKGDVTREHVLPVLLHGDAAFSGQGVVAETINLSQLQGYHTGGTIHIIINNQIGFTTPGHHGRSGFFPTDTAKMLPTPIFHVNGDDPEAIIHVMNMALAFRQTFHRDVVIDIFCFRRHGHNEGDEPSFTHPKMYKIIEKHPGVAAIYGKVCDENGVMSTAEQKAARVNTRNELKQALERSRSEAFCRINKSQGEEWDAIPVHYSEAPVDTAVAADVIADLASKLTTVAPGFNIHPKLARILAGKAGKLEDQGILDWAFAESLAFGSLLLEGIPVRLSGQDCTRGTFSQRHLAWWDVGSDHPRPYYPLNNLSRDQAEIQVYDSPLSEYSVLGFEYGYSLTAPNQLVIWEAQFGDFCNGAQVIIDNYIASAEAKWGRRSGLIMLLPHGQEGQGPDHSSGHVERFLQLAAAENIQVCNLTTPAQYFHVLRRQVRRHFRKPLIIMAPKSLLRHPKAVSKVDDLTTGYFHRILDSNGVKAKDVSRVLLCSGKIYYDLLTAREQQEDSKVAIVRVEQLYPFPLEPLRKMFKRYRNAKEIVWVQEEPRNFGPWRYIIERFNQSFRTKDLKYIGRDESGSSATGRPGVHSLQQKDIVETALRIP